MKSWWERTFCVGIYDFINEMLNHIWESEIFIILVQDAKSKRFYQCCPNSKLVICKFPLSQIFVLYQNQLYSSDTRRDGFRERGDLDHLSFWDPTEVWRFWPFVWKVWKFGPFMCGAPSKIYLLWCRLWFYDCLSVVPKLFLIAYHLRVPYSQHVPPCSRKSQCAKYNSIKSLENQNWHKCNMKKWLWESFIAIFRNQQEK